jgi:hypothetical protein
MKILFILQTQPLVVTEHLKDMQPKILIILLPLALFSACEKEPEELLIGSWSNVNTEETIAFLAEGSYHWSIPYPGVDPNCADGTYYFSGDTLIIEACGWGCYTLKYFWKADRSKLELQDIKTLSIDYYDRNSKFLN